VSAYKSPGPFSTSVGIKSKQFFFPLVCFKTGMFFPVVQNMFETLQQTEAKQKIIFFSFVKQTETD
jgi:hypothetical protein